MTELVVNHPAEHKLLEELLEDLNTTRLSQSTYIYAHDDVLLAYNARFNDAVERVQNFYVQRSDYTEKDLEQALDKLLE